MSGGGGGVGVPKMFENPVPADHRRRPVCIRRHREDAPLPQQSTATILLRERYASEPTTFHMRDAVVPCEPLVEKSVIRLKEVYDAAVLTKNALEKKLRFLTKRLP